ncbi:MAG: site-2 protease family protein [Anderseniella sp.]
MASWSSILIAVLAAASMMIVFNWRRPVALTRTTIIHRTADEIWPHVDYLASQMEWQQHLERVEVDEDAREVRLFHAMTRDDGSRVEWQLQFEVVAHEPGKSIHLRRTGIEQDQLDDRLLELDIDLTENSSATEVSIRESWGPRSLTGLALAHMDAASALARLKSYIETGKAKPKGSKGWTSVVISAASLLATASAFSLMLGWEIGVIFVGLLVLHEMGHLISFRMIGQPWGKIIFMPFLGGVAVSRVPHLRLSDDAFCAIMGAGLSVLALAPAIIVTAWEVDSPAIVQTAYAIAALAGALNLLNLLPVFPLDGGRVLRAVMQSVMPTQVRSAMFGVAGIVALGGWYLNNPVLVAIAVVAFFQSARLGPANDRIALMNPYAATVMCAAYLSLVMVHGVAMVRFWPSLG